MFRIVYCLISGYDDIYCDQLIVSLKSLRYRMADIPVSVLTDNDTNKTLTGYRSEVISLAEVKVVTVPINFNKSQRSRFLKTTVRRNVEGDYLFVDTDTVICEDISEADFSMDIAAVSDEHVDFFHNDLPPSRTRSLKRFGYHLSEYNRYFNSGVVWVKDTPFAHEFYDKWHELWLSHMQEFVYDQPAFNEINYMYSENAISEISGGWNCQVVVLKRALLFLGEAKILHYFGGSFVDGNFYRLQKDAVIKQVRQSEQIEIEQIIEHPRLAFSDSNIVNMGNEDVSDVYQSNSFHGLLYVYRHHKRFFLLLEKFFSKFRSKQR